MLTERTLDNGRERVDLLRCRAPAGMRSASGGGGRRRLLGGDILTDTDGIVVSRGFRSIRTGLEVLLLLTLPPETTLPRRLTGAGRASPDQLALLPIPRLAVVSDRSWLRVGKRLRPAVVSDRSWMRLREISHLL